jgi:hypothetical protein
MLAHRPRKTITLARLSNTRTVTDVGEKPRGMSVLFEQASRTKAPQKSNTQTTRSYTASHEAHGNAEIQLTAGMGLAFAPALPRRGALRFERMRRL